MGSTLLSSINIGRETLMGHGTAMATLADNVSNSNTTGFKSGNAVFADMLATGPGSIGVIAETNGGDGSLVASIDSNLTQGALEQTSKPYDLGVDGEGFFTIAKPDENGGATGEYYYTRNGNFQLNATGQLVTSDGYLVMSIPTGGAGDALSPITLTGRNALPVATTTAQLFGNLDAATPAIVGNLPAGPLTSNAEIARFKPFNTSVRVLDSLGQPHDLGLCFFKTGVNQAGGTIWAVRAFANGDEVAGGTPGVPVEVGALGEMTIGPDGVMIGAPAMTAKVNWGNGAAPSSVALDLAGFSGYVKSSFVSSTVTDGSVPGIAKSISFDSRGEVSVVMDNGNKTPIGSLALARFPNPTGLKRIGNTMFTSQPETGDVTYGAPREDGRGDLYQGTLESSNVDLAEQFVNVIRIQRTYQAGSQVIKTADELLSATIQIA